MSPGFDRANDLDQFEQLDPPSGRSIWIAVGVIVAALITILVVLSIVGDFGPGGSPSTVAAVTVAE